MPDGAAWAAMLAAAIGCATLAFLIDLAEASKSISKHLSFYGPAGDLSGKSTLAIFIWLIAWFILHLRWKNRRIASPARVTAVTLTFILAALIASFPPFFELFAGR